ncbi:hypothetical protein S245_065815, partial [Arachis hypogaea]
NFKHEKELLKWQIQKKLKETPGTAELLCLTALRREASEHHHFTPPIMKLMNKITSEQWVDCKIESISSDIHEEVDSHNRMLDRMGNDMDSSRGVLSETMDKFKMGLTHFDEVLREADGIIQSRGNLGIDLPPEKKPLILALSNPTSRSECTAEEAYTWSKGQAIFASGSPFDPVEYEGKVFVPGQTNNAYIFPGFGLGLLISGAIRVRDEMLLVASETLAAQVSKENYDKGLIYPPFSNIRKISAHIAANVVARYMNL